MDIGKTLYVTTRKQWRAWLQKNHAAAKEIWLVYCNNESGRASLPYEDSMEEALSFGWIDGIIKKIDKDRYTRRFSPRKATSAWSEINIERYRRAEAAGLVTEAGKRAFGDDKTRRVFVSLRKGRTAPPDLAKEFKKYPEAKKFFDSLAPSSKTHFVNRIENAKRPETRAKWLAKVVQALRRGEKFTS